jgi:Methyltransferase domain
MTGTLSCAACGTAYPIERGIPILLPRELSSLRDHEPCDADLADYQTEATPAVARLLETLGSEARVVLDIGSGRGPYLSLFTGDVVCVDLHPEFLLDAQKSASPSVRVHAVCATATALPFHPGFADLVFASEVLEHLSTDDARDALATWPTYARKWCVIDTPNGEENAPITRLRHLLYRGEQTGGEHPDRPELEHHSAFSPATFRDAGYECHGCIGWVSRKRFRLGPLWDVYDAIAWRFPALGGTLVAVATGRHDGE